MVKLLENINDFIGRTVAFFYLFAVIISCYEIAMRYFFDSPTLWAHEFVIIICGMSYLLSGGYVTKERAHVRITALYEVMSRKVRRLLDLFALIVGIICISLLIYASWRQGILAIQVWEKTGSAWDPPMYAIIKPGITVGAALVLLANIALFIKLLRRED